MSAHDRTVASALYRALDAAQRAVPDWARRHRETADRLIREHLPHGAGFDDAWHAYTKCRALFLRTEFHKMSEHGYYDGWIPIRAVALPGWEGLDIEVQCPDETLAEYAADVLYECLETTIPSP